MLDIYIYAYTHKNAGGVNQYLGNCASRARHAGDISLSRCSHAFLSETQTGTLLLSLRASRLRYGLLSPTFGRDWTKQRGPPST